MTMMKKIVAGVLAAASVLSISASAFALEGGDTKAIAKPTTMDYEVTPGLLSVELDLEVPAKLQAFLNPYGAAVVVKEKIGTTDAITSSNTLVSYAYEFVNNTKDFGVSIDVTQKTTENGDAKCATAGTTGTVKNIQMALQCAKTVALAEAVPASPANAKMTSTAAGCIVMSGTEATQSGWGHVPAYDETNKAPGKSYAAFVGKLETKGTDVLDWTEDDNLTVALTFKFNPGAKTLA